MMLLHRPKRMPVEGALHRMHYWIGKSFSYLSLEHPVVPSLGAKSFLELPPLYMRARFVLYLQNRMSLVLKTREHGHS